MLQKSPNEQLREVNQVLELSVDNLSNSQSKDVTQSNSNTNTNNNSTSTNTAANAGDITDNGNEISNENGVTMQTEDIAQVNNACSNAEDIADNENDAYIDSTNRVTHRKNTETDANETDGNGRKANEPVSDLTVQFFHRFNGTNASNISVNGERSKELDGKDGVAVIKFEKMDANNNGDEVVPDKYAEAENEKTLENGNIGGTGVKKKKKMDSDDDDTRPINPRQENEVPEVNTRTPKLISWWIWFAYSQGHVFNDLCASMWFTYLMAFFQKCVRLSASNAGLLMLIGQVADALATPVIGLFSDRVSDAWYCGLGRRKTWHIVGTMLVTLSFPFIFSPVLPLFSISNDASYVLYYTPFICLFQFGWAAVQIAHLSLVPDLTPNDHERTSLLSVRYAFTVISNLLVYVIMLIAVGRKSDETTGVKDNLNPDDSTKFQYISYIVVIIGYLSTLIFYAGVSEIRNRRLQLDMRQSSSSQMYEARKRTIGQLLRLPTLYTVAVLYMTARMFFNILQMFIVFYVEDTLQLTKKNIALVPLVILISGFVTSLGVKQINVKLGRRWSHMIGLGLGIAVSVIVFSDIAQTYIYIVYIIAVLYGMSSTVIQVTSFGMAADFVGDDVSNGAFIYGVLSFADKTSNGIVGYVIQHFNPEKSYYYRLALSYGCGIPCLIGVLALVFLTPLPQVKLKVTAESDDKVPVVTAESSEEDIGYNNTIVTQVDS